MNINIDKKRNDYSAYANKMGSTKNLDFTSYYK